MKHPYDQTLTLSMIRAHGPCDAGWRKLLSGLGKTAADDEPLTISDVYRINGYDDALWCLRALPDDRLSRHFQAWCADQVLHLFEREHPNDTRVRDQIVMLRRDDATEEERSAARAAAGAARDAAWNAARAAGDAWAARAAAGAAWAAAWDAARAAGAARAAAGDAGDAAWAAWAAAVAAGDAAWAAWAAQERQFCLMIGVDQ